MERFSNSYQYDGNMDKEVIPLCNAINSLPGLLTIDSCCGHGKGVFSIFFKCNKESSRGLFFLTRCCDKRYFKHNWVITLSVGDVIIDGVLPTIFCLTSFDKGQRAYDQAVDLLHNMELHLNHHGFIKGFLDGRLNDFKT